MNDNYPLALQAGTVLAGQYIIDKVLGQGGFGITYEATDHKTGAKVAVKEFFPDAMATRTNQTTVMPFTGERGESYGYGKTCFLQEAETLAQFIGNENIIRIQSYFEENGTAYFVMDFIEGISFDEYIKEHGGKVPWEDTARILVPVMDALGVVHSRGIIHRDVAPDNIYITKDGTVKLLDFGAARYSLGDKSRSLDVVLKHGFAPKEQYTRRGRQGPFTDVYSLGATFYFALTGKRPQDSVERMDEDDLVPPSALGVQIGRPQEDAILKALSVQPAERFQSMAEFKGALMGSGGESPQTAPDNAPVTAQRFFTAPEPAPGDVTAAGGAASGPGRTAGIPGPTLGQMAGTGGSNALQSGGAGSGKKPGKKALIAAAAVVVVVLAGGLLLSAGQKDTPAGASNAGEDRESSSDGAEDSLAFLDATAEPTPEVTAAPESAATPEPTPEVTATPEPAVGFTGDFTLVSDVGNIMNGGKAASWNGVRYFITGEGHEIWGDDKEYVYKEQTGTFSDLTVEDGKLYYLYNGSGFVYDLEMGGTEKISVLNDLYGGELRRLLVTKDYYIVCSGNSDGTMTVSCVSRTDGESAECCTIENEKGFTVSDDGWLYYAVKEENTPYLRCMRLDTFEEGLKVITSKFSGIGYCNLLMADGFLYYCVYRDTDPAFCRIERVAPDLDLEKGYTVWDLGSKINICTSSRNFGFNINMVSQDMFFYAAADENAAFPELYKIKGYDDENFDIEEIRKEGYGPTAIYLEDGGCDLFYYYQLTGEDGTNTEKCVRRQYDKDGNGISTTE